MNFLVTGVNSYLGGVLGSYLACAGHTVYGTVRTSINTGSIPPWLKHAYVYELGGFVDRDMFREIDLVIHLVHDFRPGMGGVSIFGTGELVQAAMQAGVRRQFYISSCSAGPDAASEYGRTKFSIERDCLAKNQIVIRPGLVVGNGGLFRRMVNFGRRLPVIPLPDGGNQRIPIIDELSLCRAVTELSDGFISGGGEYNLFHPETITLKRLLKKIAVCCGRKIIFISLPGRLVLPLLAFCNRTGLIRSVSADNLKGVLGRSSCGFPSHLRQFTQDIPLVDNMIENGVKKVLVGENNDRPAG